MKTKTKLDAGTIAKAGFSSPGFGSWEVRTRNK